MERGLSQPEGRRHGRQTGRTMSGTQRQVLEPLECLPSMEARSLGLAAHLRKPHSLPWSRRETSGTLPSGPQLWALPHRLIPFYDGSVSTSCTISSDLSLSSTGPQRPENVAVEERRGRPLPCPVADSSHGQKLSGLD